MLGPQEVECWSWICDGFINVPTLAFEWENSLISQRFLYRSTRRNKISVYWLCWYSITTKTIKQNKTACMFCQTFHSKCGIKYPHNLICALHQSIKWNVNLKGNNIITTCQMCSRFEYVTLYVQSCSFMPQRVKLSLPWNKTYATIQLIHKHFVEWIYSKFYWTQFSLP